MWSDVLKRQVDVAQREAHGVKFKSLLRGWVWSEHNACLARIPADSHACVVQDFVTGVAVTEVATGLQEQGCRSGFGHNACLAKVLAGL